MRLSLRSRPPPSSKGWPNHTLTPRDERPFNDVGRPAKTHALSCGAPESHNAAFILKALHSRCHTYAAIGLIDTDNLACSTTRRSPLMTSTGRTTLTGAEFLAKPHGNVRLGAGLAAHSKNIQVFATVHLPSTRNSPRWISCHGRIGLNVVARYASTARRIKIAVVCQPLAMMPPSSAVTA